MILFLKSWGKTERDALGENHSRGDSRHKRAGLTINRDGHSFHFYFLYSFQRSHFIYSYYKTLAVNSLCCAQNLCNPIADISPAPKLPLCTSSAGNQYQCLLLFCYIQ